MPASLPRLCVWKLIEGHEDGWKVMEYRGNHWKYGGASRGLAVLVPQWCI